MSDPPIPDREEARLAALRKYRILDTLPEEAYDDIVYLASKICDTEIALVSLIDSDRQWFKAKLGIEASETQRDVAFCSHAIMNPGELMIVPDASRDARFANNPLVLEDPAIRFYAGAPLETSDGLALGTLCVIDFEPRQLDEDQQAALAALSRQVMTQLELRRAVSELERQAASLEEYRDGLEEYQMRLEEANASLQKLSRTDRLTGLANRAAFDDRLSEELRRSERSGSPVGLILLDIDWFKSYNDDFGHPAGDELLRALAEVLARCARGQDFVARYGGEEFGIVLPDTDRAGAEIFAERLRATIAAQRWSHRPITISAGVATTSESLMSDEALLAAADGALYEAKRSGRNRVCEA